jgi:phosphoglycerate dehydrogenase-like enzyme
MDTQTGERDSEPAIYVGPDENQFGPGSADAVREAVERGGGKIPSAPEDAEAMVWLGSASDLAGLLHENVRWVQLHSAGVESWVDSGSIDERRVFPSAARAYAGTVAEHALALMLAGARRLHESARATERGNRWGRLFAGSTVVLLGAGGIGRALIRLLEPFDTHVLAVTRSGREVPGATESYAAARPTSYGWRATSSFSPPPPLPPPAS